MGENGSPAAERPKLGGEFHQHPLRPQGMGSDPQDGLPRAASTLSMEDALAPPLAPETFVCMGDESAFVIRDHWGDVLLSVAPERARAYHGEYGVPPGWLAPLSQEEHAQARCPASVLGGDQLWYRVEPLRPQCAHYRRIMTDFEGQEKHVSVERVCAAQRTEGGEYFSLGNLRIHACEHRLPRDFVSEQRLRKFDEARVAEGRKTEEFWDGEAALQAMLAASAEEEKKDKEANG